MEDGPSQNTRTNAGAENLDREKDVNIRVIPKKDYVACKAVKAKLAISNKKSSNASEMARNGGRYDAVTFTPSVVVMRADRGCAVNSC